MENITRTVYAAMVQTAAYLGVATPILENTTLNESLDINRTDRPSPTERPTVSLFVWGNMGHDFTRGADGIARNIIVPHRATDGGLFNCLPFVLRELNNDLPAQQRLNYALRKQVVYNGRNYFAYYGRRFSKDGVVPIASYVSVDENGKETITSFNPTRTNLNPTPPAMDSSGVWVNSGDYVTVKARIELAMTEGEVNDMKEVARLIYGSESYAIMSEIGICTCVDRTVRASGAGGSQFNFNEAIATQIASHLSVNYDLQYVNDYLSIAIDVGANEPLYKTSPYDALSSTLSTGIQTSLTSINGSTAS